MNIKIVNKWIKNLPSGYVIIILDLSKAYHRVNRKILFKIL